VEPADSLYAAVVVNSSVNTMRLALTWWEAKGRSVPATDILAEAFDVLERGLVPPTPKKKK
jgi:hypothetical protein